MNEQNGQVISSVSSWLEQGDQVLYATVVSTWGASPRPKGSLFAYNLTKRVQVGSLSGGCIEDALVEELDTGRVPNQPSMRVYGESDEERSRFQLPCGGTMTLMLEPLTERHQAHFNEIARALDARELIKRSLCLETGRSQFISIDKSTGDSQVALSSEAFGHVLGPRYQVLIVGVGEVARSLIDALSALDFHVELCDARKDVVDRHRAQEWGVPLHICLPDDLVEERFSDSYSAVVALAHDPRVDDLALMAGLRASCFFVGAMGSQRTSENRAKRLRELGFTNEELDVLHAPIGISIGSKLPAEIAISISAQLIKERHLTSTAVSNSKQ